MERSFAREVESLKLGNGDVFHGEGILAITKALLQSGVAYIGGYQGAPVSHLLDVMVEARRSSARPRHPCRDLRQRGAAGRAARRVDPLSVARRRHVEVDRRHQCRGGRAVEPLVPRRHGRRAHHCRRGLRRRRQRHPGTLPRLRAEVVALACSIRAPIADHRQHGRKGVRTIRGVEHADDDGAAHPRVPRVGLRRSKDNRAAALGAAPASPSRRPSTMRGCRIRPRPSCQESRQDEQRRLPAAQKFIVEHRLNEYFGPRAVATSASSFRAVCSTL